MDVVIKTDANKINRAFLKSCQSKNFVFDCFVECLQPKNSLNHSTNLFLGSNEKFVFTICIINSFIEHAVD